MSLEQEGCLESEEEGLVESEAGRMEAERIENERIKNERIKNERIENERIANERKVQLDIYNRHHMKDLHIMLHNNCRQNDRNGRLSHLLLTGGCYYVAEERTDIYNRFGKNFVTDYNNNTLPCITEVHTAKFPMYADADFKLPKQMIDADAIHKMTIIMNLVLHTCYPASGPFRCVVCTKSKGGTLCDDGYKNGIHFHWPELIVTIDYAFTLRQHFVWALGREDWTDALGLDLNGSGAWDDILDLGVYKASERGGGLRMVGAPKARKCPNDHFNVCNLCSNKKYILDDNVYRPFTVVCGDRVDGDRLRMLNTNISLLLCSTTVRCKSNVVVTPGWNMSIPTEQYTVANKGGKLTVKSLTQGKTAFRGNVINDPQVLGIIRKMLVTHSEMYQESQILAKFDGKKYRVDLREKNSTFCLNKNACHSSNHVYMEIFKYKSNFEFMTQMKCYCPKPIKRTCGVTCKLFGSKPKPLNRDEAEVLFLCQESDYVSSTTSMNPDVQRRLKKAWRQENKTAQEQRQKAREISNAKRQK